MKKRTIIDKISRFLKYLYLKIFRINDSPEKIALGFGLGVFLGVFPGVGPIASLFVAMVLRINRASALLGCLITNTWISVITFMLSIKVGAAFLGSDWQEVQTAYSQMLKDFHWADIFKESVLKVFGPVVLGYLLVACCFAFVAYLIVWLVAKKVRLKMSRGKKISGR